MFSIIIILDIKIYNWKIGGKIIVDEVWNEGIDFSSLWVEGWMIKVKFFVGNIVGNFGKFV